MKKLSYSLSLLLLLMCMTIFTSCKDDGGDETNPQTDAQINADNLAGTYTVTTATRGENTPVDLEGQTVTLTFEANDDGMGGIFTADNADLLPGDAALPETGTWEWLNSANYNSVVLNPGNITLNFTSTLGASPLTFTYTATDAKGSSTVTVTATK